jgi:hypothetical protein
MQEGRYAFVFNGMAWHKIQMNYTSSKVLRGRCSVLDEKGAKAADRSLSCVFARIGAAFHPIAFSDVE